ncbi:MAG: GWxTD domain-containing protein [Candidatus Krumholzibacteriia bacterium]
MLPLSRQTGVACVLAGIVAGCAGTALRPQTAPHSDTLHAWLAWHEDGRPVYRIALSVPHSELRHRANAAARPRCRVILSATVLDRSGRVIGGEAWTSDVEVAGVAADPLARYERLVELPTSPGRQELMLGVIVQGNVYAPEWRRRFEVPGLEPDLLLLGEPQFLKSDSGAAGVAPGSAREINVGHYYDGDTGPPRVRAAAYDFAPAAEVDSYTVVWGVRDVEGNEILRGDRALERSGSISMFEIDLPVETLGSYWLRMELRHGTRVATAEQRFEVGLADLASLADLGGGLELLRLILPEAKLEELTSAGRGERGRLLEAYWRQRDPNPSTPANEYREEIMRRIRHANIHFSGSQMGWRTDRGRVYIRMGPPDLVDTLESPHAFDRLQRWTYHDGNKVFVFIDRGGRGDFVLYRSNAEDL